MTIDDKYKVFPFGNTKPTALDQRITAILKEIEQIRAELYASAPGNPQLRMHNNLMPELSNLDVKCHWLLQDYHAYWAVHYVPPDFTKA